MAKLNDSKFIHASVERARQQVTPKPAFDPADAATLRGIGERRARTAQAQAQAADGSYEPVFFQHPETGRRIYGWLVAVRPDGTAQVEIGDGEYALVTPDEIRRIGNLEHKEKVRAQLKESIGTVLFASNGIRSDIYETIEPTILDEDSGIYMLPLHFSASVGEPSREELLAYMAQAHPDAEVLDMESNIPGRIGLAIRLAEDKEAEMGPAIGGEVLETLDPEDVQEKQAIFGFGGPKRTVTPAEAAKFLLENKVQFGQQIEEALQTYMQNGGGRALLQTQGAFNTERLLQAAMPVVQRANPRLWKSVANATAKSQAESSLDKAPKQVPADPEQAAMDKAVQNALPMGQQAPQVSQTDPEQARIDEAVYGAQPTSSPSQPSSPSMGAPKSPKQVGPAKAQPPPAPGASGVAPPEVLDQARKLFESSPDTKNITNPGARQRAVEQLAQQLMQESKTGESEEEPEEKKEMKAGKRSLFGKKIAEIDKDASKAKAEKPQHYGLPPSAREAFTHMRLHRLARRGEYIVGRVEWDRKMFETIDPAAVKNQVISFVKSQISSGEARASFGPTGRVSVLEFDADKGQAQVKFSSLHAGSVPTEVVSPGDGDTK